jgi:hypothetical protein
MEGRERNLYCAEPSVSLLFPSRAFSVTVLNLTVIRIQPYPDDRSPSVVPRDRDAVCLSAPTARTSCFRRGRDECNSGTELRGTVGSRGRTR